MRADAEWSLTQTGRHGLDARTYFAMLTRDPVIAALFFRSQQGFKANQDPCIQHTVGQRLPTLDTGSLTTGGRNQFAYGRHRVQIFHNHARIEHRTTILHDQTRYLA
jgi:hypothetical protein